MIQRSFRSLLPALFLCLAPVGAAAQLGTPSTLRYGLEAPSSFQEGCLPPCLCPVLFYDTLVGTFDLTPVFPSPLGISNFMITNIDFVMVDFFGAQRTVTGTGTYQLSGQVLPQHHLQMDVSIDGAPIQHHDSGLVPGGLDFPRIDISAALNGFFCYDEVFELHATPELVTNYCMSTANSTGSPAVISATGTSSFSVNDLALHCGPMPANEPGIFYFGQGQTQIPFGDGFRCVTGATVYRLFPVVFSGTNQVMDLALDNGTFPASQLTPGSSWNFQGWFRDPAGGGTSFNLSDGARVLFLP